MSSLSFHVVIVIAFCVQMIVADCPRLCECKWKSGKESVICLNANLSSVPLLLDAGTQVLDLTGNNLATVKHDEFSRAGLLNLQKVYISKCRLKSLERFAFRNLINLVELDLSYNALATVPSHTLDSVPELRELKLSGNPIQRILNDAFINVKLIRLELSDCRIGSIEPRAFSGLEQSLEWLNLDKNRLVEVKSPSFTILRNLHGLDLAGNPWNCSCIMRPLREWMLRKNVPFDVPPTCHYPKRLSSKPWDKLDLDEFACVPEIFAYESKTHGIEGKNVTMTCRITGIPEPSVRWLLKNKVIANLSSSSYSNGKKLYMVHLQNNSSNLTIFSADLQDAGVYVCAAENKAGRVEASVTLAVIRNPPESSLGNKIVIVSVITGIVLVLVSCLITMCVYSFRKRQLMRWDRECSREDNYEKIELNHKMASNSNGGPVYGEIALVGSRKNGDYCVVPAGDTDQEVEEEEESSTVATMPKVNPTWNNDHPLDKQWNSPDHLLDPEDLHIPRRTLQEARDDIKKAFSSTSGTSSYYEQPSTSVAQLIPGHLQVSPYANGNKSDLSNWTEGDGEKKFPDLIDNSTSFKQQRCSRANSEGGSVTDIAELFCTLPRKRALVQSAKYRSSDSESPLLPESRYSSSGPESTYGSQESNLRKLSDCQKYKLASTAGLNRNKVNKISNSSLSLTRDDSVVNSTPLLDVSNLENRMSFAVNAISSPCTAPNVNSYDYHTAQLEMFLEEYLSLQKQLAKIRETCNNWKQDKAQFTQETYPGAPAVTSSLSSDDLTKNNAFSSTLSPNSNQLIQGSLDFRNFQSELTKYLLAKNASSSPKAFPSNSGMYNN